MLGKGKDNSSGGARFSASNDDVRLFSKALDLLNSSNPDSDHELLELVKKAKRDADKELALEQSKRTGLQSSSSSEVTSSSSGNPAAHGSRTAAGRGEKQKRKAGRS